MYAYYAAKTCAQAQRRIECPLGRLIETEKGEEWNGEVRCAMHIFPKRRAMMVIRASMTRRLPVEGKFQLVCMFLGPGE